MRLTVITVSGANEFTDIKALLRICEKYPLAEIGVQVSGDKAAFGMARYWWIWALCFYATPMTQIALHLNKDWVEDFCAGKVPKELKTFLEFRHQNGLPVISRVQLNFKVGREKTPDVARLADMIRFYDSQRFILSYNDSNKEIIDQLYQVEDIEFDCLYDESFGNGIVPDKRKSPAFPNMIQGYAGGLSPQNVLQTLNQIKQVLPANAEFYIDAQKGLEDENEHFSLEKCHAFLRKASKWVEKQLL